MPRDIPIGNGRMLVAFDPEGRVRDLYFPHVGQENHVGGAEFRVGIWEAGRFAWLPSGCETSVRYLDDTMVSDIAWAHRDLQLALRFNDVVDFHDNLFVRRVTLRNLAPGARRLRVFFGFDFRIAGNDIGDTAAMRSGSDGLVHYKNDRYFLVNGLFCGRPGFDQFAVGKRGHQGFEGTWKDAEDGDLSGNAVAQGSVDSVVGLHVAMAGSAEETVWLWLAAGTSWDEVRELNASVLRRGPDKFWQRTADYWRFWTNKEPANLAPLPEAVRRLYRRSLLVMRAHVNHNGGITAANDSDNIEFNRDTYSYVWPRDGALTANAFDLAGYPESSRAFFQFCASVVEREGYFLHKYTPAGLSASSWHPWIRNERTQLPIQEDETALVLWALWEHYRRYRDIEFITPLYRPLIKNPANFLMNYRDPETGLPLPSYDLWEERRAVWTHTVAAVHGGLEAGAHFAEAFGERDLARDYREGAAQVKEAALRHLCGPGLGGFARGFVVPDDGTGAALDSVPDVSTFGIFSYGMLPADDPRVAQTVARVHDALWCRTPVGGLARYQNDAYFRSRQDGPGNPWFVATLWYAQYLAAGAKTAAEAGRALELLNWTCQHALPSGVLPEQLDPESGQPLSVSPLTWSHAAFVTAVHRYLEAVARVAGQHESDRRTDVGRQA